MTACRQTPEHRGAWLLPPVYRRVYAAPEACQLEPKQETEAEPPPVTCKQAYAPQGTSRAH